MRLLRLLPILLSVQMVVGCTTTTVVTYGDFRQQFKVGQEHVVVQDQQGARARIDPMSLIVKLDLAE